MSEDIVGGGNILTWHELRGRLTATEAENQRLREALAAAEQRLTALTRSIVRCCDRETAQFIFDAALPEAKP